MQPVIDIQLGVDRAVDALRCLVTTTLPPWSSVVLVDPEYFDVQWAINAHMRTADGALQKIDRVLARQQWSALRAAYERLGFRTLVMPAHAGLCDQVFCANPAFPFSAPQGGASTVLLSAMRHAERAAEPGLMGEFLRAQGVQVVLRAEGATAQEGNGDLLFVPGRNVLLGGIGPRSERSGLIEAAAAADAPLVLFRLEQPDYYHLDTCVAPLNARTALFVPEAFLPEDLRLLAALFPKLLPVPEGEGRSVMAANAHSPDGRNVLIDAAACATRQLLAAEGFEPVPLDTSEFRKAGGSVFCMKLMLFAGRA
ncbi:MAG: amidinotransferase [Planctomycetes bacterium]|nr:amidinotransferase [Planctomycetota bacterium]